MLKEIWCMQARAEQTWIREERSTGEVYPLAIESLEGHIPSLQ